MNRFFHFASLQQSLLLALVLLSSISYIDASEPQWRRYFDRRVKEIQNDWIAKQPAPDKWREYQTELRNQLAEMLGLKPFPEKRDLQPQITATHERDGVTVENIVFQSRPGLYVTANFYRPTDVQQPLPAIVYLCGHGEVKRNGVSYGNKVHYQHHGAWLAKNGYVCLTIDTVQLGEIEGIHHGTYKLDMWWWLNRGYTPAGVEAWNAIRSVDYLLTRKEVDGSRIGVSGRSGGGAYSWWLAALDERVACAVPVAGITDLHNHVIDDCVQGHCDCMYFVNKYRWDYTAVASLVSPRPLLISNTDRDAIFPLEGVVRIHEGVRNIYRQQGNPKLLGLNITAGEHVDTQELQVHALRWFNTQLKNDKSVIPNAAQPLFTPDELKVLKELPADQKNTTVQEWFVDKATPPLPPSDASALATWKSDNRKSLREGPFRNWPRDPIAHPLTENSTQQLQLGDGGPILNAQTWKWSPDPEFELEIGLITSPTTKELKNIQVYVPSEQEIDDISKSLQLSSSATPNKVYQLDDKIALIQKWKDFLRDDQTAIVTILPRGVGSTSWPGDKKAVTQFHRRLYLIGETLDSLQVFDIAEALLSLTTLERFKDCTWEIDAQGTMAVNAAYGAAMIAPPVATKRLRLPDSFRDGPYYFNIERK